MTQDEIHIRRCFALAEQGRYSCRRGAETKGDRDDEAGFDDDDNAEEDEEGEAA